MATGINSLTFHIRSPRAIGKGRGLRCLTGQMVLSTTNVFYTSGVENRFRRCFDIHVNATSGVLVNWHRHATHKAGALRTYACSGASTTSATFLNFNLQGLTSCTFTAFGI